MLSVCILLATLNRPVLLRRVLQSLKDTAPQLPVMCAVDPDDATAPAILAEFGASVAVCPERRKGPANAWNTALRAAPDYDAYFLAADDLIFKPGWFEEVMKALARIGNSGMVGTNDGKKNGGTGVVTHYLLTRDFIIKHNGGTMCCPHYRTLGPDTETTDIARSVGKYTWAESAMTIHDWHGDDIKADATYIQAREHRNASKMLYYRRRDAGFPIDWEPIIK